MNTQPHKHPQSQRISRASVAVITRRRDGHTQWLLQWNEKWQAMNLIAGHKEITDVNDLTCLVREIHEELFEDLSAKESANMQTVLGQNNDAYTCLSSTWPDVYIETITRIGTTPFEYIEFSNSAKCLTQYIFHVYKVLLQANISLIQDNAFGISVPHEINEWVSVKDIRRGITSVGRPISKTVQRILTWIHTQEEREQ
jgi:hypothetical protein